ncbi:MAG: hypothetical protein PUK31_01000 [Candidatus Methanomethylophilaceae archaeon]|nr:hypothetical protein [Candidatus Methanomethylophilaceae archaeon]MDY5872621.1 hypothetical protein [Candidatus Methanomethylophilaceae archaeon]
MADIIVDDDVRQMILDAKQDYRVCTACRGPALVPITVKPAKPSDIIIPIGDYKLYISIVQSEYVSRVSMDMLYSENDIYSCPALSTLRSMGWIDKK